MRYQMQLLDKFDAKSSEALSAASHCLYLVMFWLLLLAEPSL